MSHIRFCHAGLTTENGRTFIIDIINQKEAWINQVSRKDQNIHKSDDIKASIEIDMERIAYGGRAL